MAIRVHTLNEIKEKRPSFLALGSFDGVHLGHQALLKQLVQAAHAAHARAAVLTFFPHPKRVILGLTDRYYITSLEERVSLLANHGVVRMTSATDFVDQLCQHLQLKALWGGDIKLGYQQEGDHDFLQQLGKVLNFSVNAVPKLITVGDERVSSTRIRNGLKAGDMADVNACLGRPFSVHGIVVHGDQRGRTIGFPTANLAVWEEQLIPANGVFATIATVDGQPYPAATNVGRRPTVDGVDLRIEAHLLDFAGDLYDKEVTLQFISRVRDERKFDGLAALKAQIDADVAQVRQQLIA